MLKCREVEANSSRLLDGDLPLGTRLSMRLHMLICVHCRRFVRHLRQVRDMVRYRGRPSEPDETVAEVNRCLEQAEQNNSTKSQ